MMDIKIFQNFIPLFQLHHNTFHVPKNHSIRHFNKCVESIII